MTALPGSRRVALGVGLAVVAVFALAYARAAEFNFDEFYFLDAARNLALHGRYATFLNGEFRLFDPYLSTGPTVIGPVALAFVLGGPDYFVARLVMVGAFALLFVLVYRVTTELGGRAAGLLACLFLLTVPQIWEVGLRVLGEVPALVLFLAGIQLLVRAERPGGPPRQYAVAGLCLGLAALTKLVFLLGVGALAGLALVMAVREGRRAWGPAAGVGLGLAVLGGWELCQWLVAGDPHYWALKRQFLRLFVRESGVWAWWIPDLGILAEQTLATVQGNLEVLRAQPGLVGIQFFLALGVVFFRLGRTLRPGGGSRRVHGFLALFFLSYLLWFFLARHDRWYRLLFPAHLLFGLCVAPWLVELTQALGSRRAPAARLALGVTAASVLVGVIGLPLVENTRQYVRTVRERPARSHLELVDVLRRHLREDSKVGYWTWWRAPEVAFFLPNPFFDVSRVRYRHTFAPERDFLLATAPQRKLEGPTWERLRRFCGEIVVALGDNVLCRFGGRAKPEAIDPDAASPRLDFVAGGSVPEAQLVDGVHDAEGRTFRWMNSDAEVLLGVTASRGRGRVHVAFRAPEFLWAREQRPVEMGVLVDGRAVSTLRLTAPGPASLVTACVGPGSPRRPLRVRVATDRFFVPQELGLNDDRRELALQLATIEFRPDADCDR